MKRIFTGVVLVLLLTGMLTLAFNIQPVKAEATIYIRADGSLEPEGTPISTVDNVTYIFNDNIYDEIVVERGNIIIDGNGYALQGSGFGNGFYLSGTKNVTIKDTSIGNFAYGVYLGSASNNTICGNNITANNEYGIYFSSIYFSSSSNNSIFGNNVVNNKCGIALSSDNNAVCGNSVTNSDLGISLFNSSNNIVCENNVTNNDYGIHLGYSSDNNAVCGNSVTDNNLGITLSDVSNNTVSGNSIIDNYGDGVYLNSSNNTVSGNNITANREDGIYLIYGSNNIVCGNNMAANNQYGIHLDDSPNNNISGNVFVDDGLFVSDSYLNAVVDNLVNGKPLVYLEDLSNMSVGQAGQVILVNCSSIKVKNQNLSHTTVGVELWGANYTTVCGNNITYNHYGTYLGGSSNNNVYHNNFVNNIEQVYEAYDSVNNKWDDGYPSGGNYWSDYTGVDVKKGPYQDETGSDGVGDTPHYGDNYPLMNPWPSGLSLHELDVALSVLTHLPLGNLTSVEAAVTNNGINIEQNVTISLFVNNTIVNSTIISILDDGSFYTITYPWTPTAKGIYNITAYVNPVSGETSTENNQETEFVTVSPPPEVGVKTGDWIKVDYTVAHAPPGTTLPLWLKVEFLSVEGTNATVRVTMRMSDGTEQNATVPVDVVAGGQAFGFSGFVIPANLTAGDVVYMSGYGNVTIAGETTGSYAGASRTVVYADFSQYGTELTYYWDKQTGVMVEASTTSITITGTGRATETNMWQPAPGFPIDPTLLYVVIAVLIVATTAFLVMRRRKGSTKDTTSETDGHE